MKYVKFSDLRRAETRVITVQEFVDLYLVTYDYSDPEQNAINNIEKLSTAIAVLCQIFADKGLLSIEDIKRIAFSYTKDEELIDRGVKCSD